MKNNTSDFKKDSLEIIDNSVKTFLNTKVKDFAKYVIETRAMPSLMDGMRPGGRKILYAAMTGELSKKETIKLPTLIGNSMAFHYNHGDAALMNTIVQLASSHVLKYHPLEIIGQIGTLKVPKSDTAPRYLHVEKSPYLEWFKHDIELLERLKEEGDLIEPKYFLPIVPIVLLYRTNSPGYGFSYRSFSYTLDSIIDNCIKSILSGSCEPQIDAICSNEIQIIPEINGIKHENLIYNSSKESWYNVGEYTLNIEKDQIIITDLPYNISFETFNEHLLNLKDKAYILDFTNLSMDGKIRYVIQFAKNRLNILMKDQWKFFQQMKLYSKIPKDTLNCIDIDGKMIYFETPYKLIDHFIKRRIFFYEKRKTRTINLLREEIKDISDKIKFIQLIIDEKIIINKRSIADIKIDLNKYSLSTELLKLSIGRLTQDEITKQEKNKKEVEDYLEYILKTPSKEMYIKELIEFKKKYSQIHIYNGK